MRNVALSLAVALLAVAPSAFAQQQRGATEVMAFVKPAGTSSETTFDGFGVAIRHYFHERVSGEVSVARETGRLGFITGELIFVEEKVRAYPIDVTANYHYVNDTRWQAYTGLGVRHVSAPKESRHTWSDRTTPEFTAGIEFRATPHVLLRADIKALLADDTLYDDSFKSTFGVGWRF